MKCINTKHPEFLALLKETGLRPFQLELKVVAWQLANNTDVFPTSQQLGINYTFKLFDSLDKVQRNKFDKTKLQGWINDLSKYGVTKQQLEIFQEYAKDGMTKEEIIASISADLSFVVESNVTTVKKEGQIDSQKNITSNEFEVAWNSGEQLYDNLNSRMVKYNGVIYTHYKDLNVYIKPTEKEDLFQPTSHYSSLTVPGGTNYTENEIRTPHITPSIKGHAQFSTDFGVGWHRADERVLDFELLLQNGTIKQIDC